MELTDQNLAQIRDYVGTTDPSDNTLYEYAETATYWQEVALRVLRRRRAELTLTGTNANSFTLTGVLSVGMKTGDTKVLDEMINDLQNQLNQLTGKPTGMTVSKLRRYDRL